MSEAPPITLERLTVADDETLDFLLASYRELFGSRIETAAVPRDLQRFADHYGAGRGCLLIARGSAGEPIGSIAYRPYDRRFPQLAYPGERVVEVVRLFVAPRQRRQGLARRLFATLLAQARRDAVERLYLHTHPFLPGAEAFWLGQGFQVVERETTLPWQTIHLDRRLDSPQASAGPRQSR
ncbi:GNAT family N-acetyltransferase [Pseudomonas sp. MS15a(2019)]|uniref:GNAT family N-acetyltransferase n=1 Tax=Pseudomonas sp. MS15a(2019) TaxID=2579938 RepID=UPI0015642C09|nr:GNAT family N-acetyltransferase [Pseudomonas sp. MS15a(2019)]NRH44827.1 GNAT family N-acetyltransferase [Pseudomonas sp. MS15a(2019)]